MRLRRGITLIELLVSIAIIGILTVAVTQAFAAGLNYETNAAEARERALVRDRAEEKLLDIFRHAYLSANQADTASYFIGSHGGEVIGSSEPADTVTFTIQGQRPDGPLVASTDDFETINQKYGPPGGVAEISLSTTPVGDAGNREGLFIRTQRPSDSEPLQGGVESVLDPEIRSITFEFWDGTTWQPSWSTQQGAAKRLPAAVRIVYSMDDDVSHTLVVRIPNSDVTADNPAQMGGIGG